MSFTNNFCGRKKTLDFGDLVYRAVRLLQENAAVKREVCAKYDAIFG